MSVDCVTIKSSSRTAEQILQRVLAPISGMFASIIQLFSRSSDVIVGSSRRLSDTTPGSSAWLPKSCGQTSAWCFSPLRKTLQPSNLHTKTYSQASASCCVRCALASIKLNTRLDGEGRRRPGNTVSVCLKLVGLCCIIRSYRKRSHHVYGFITSLPLATYPYIFFSHIRSGIRAYVCQYAPTQKDPGSFTTPRRVAGHALQYADASLRADGDVVLEAVRQKVYSMEFAADELKAVKAFILKATLFGILREPFSSFCSFFDASLQKARKRSRCSLGNEHQQRSARAFGGGHQSPPASLRNGEGTEDGRWQLPQASTVSHRAVRLTRTSC